MDGRIDNVQHPHCAMVFLLDASGSMDGTKISALGESLRCFKNDVECDELASKRLDLAVVKFDDDVRVILDFSSIHKFDPPTLAGNGQARMGDAILKAVEMVEAREDEYRNHGIDYYQPLIITITDGNPTDMQPGDEKWKQVRKVIQDGEKKRKFRFFMCVFKSGPVSTIKELTPPHRPPIVVSGIGSWLDLFRWIAPDPREDSDPNNMVPLESPIAEGWGIVLGEPETNAPDDKAEVENDKSIDNGLQDFHPDSRGSVSVSRPGDETTLQAPLIPGGWGIIDSESPASQPDTMSSRTIACATKRQATDLTFVNGSGATVWMGNEIGRGGEGAIHRVLHPCVAKVFHGPPSFQMERKLRAMIMNPPSGMCGSIAWPIDLLYRDKERSSLAGFMMPEIDTNQYKRLLNYVDPAWRKSHAAAFTWRHLHYVARNLSMCVAAIHESGHCIGDLNETNVLVNDDRLVAIIDTDSFQVKDRRTGQVWRCTVGKPDYTAPEIMNRNFSEVDRTEDTDNFALAVLIFQLLMEGFHPYSARCLLHEVSGGVVYSREDKIIRGVFPYADPAKGTEPPTSAPPFQNLHPDIRDLFIRCFREGHSNSSLRPSAKEWMSVLDRVKDTLIQCQSYEAHWYFDHVESCPWCGRIVVGWGDMEGDMNIEKGESRPYPGSHPSSEGWGTIST